MKRNILNFILITILLSACGSSKLKEETTTQTQTETTTIQTTLATTTEETTTSTTEETTEDTRPVWEKEVWSSMSPSEKVSSLNSNWELIATIDEFHNPTGRYKLCGNLINGGYLTIGTYSDSGKPYIALSTKDGFPTYTDSYYNKWTVTAQNGAGETIPINGSSYNLNIDGKDSYNFHYCTNGEIFFQNNEYAELISVIKNTGYLKLLCKRCDSESYHSFRFTTSSSDSESELLEINTENFDRIFEVWLNTVYD